MRSSCLRVSCWHDTSQSADLRSPGPSIGRLQIPDWSQLAVKAAFKNDAPMGDRTIIEGGALHIHRVAAVSKVEAS